MNSVGPMLLPLASALIYVAGALLVKRSNDFGVGVWRTAFVSNCTSALFFLLLLPLGGQINLDRWWEPVIVGVVFILGQIFNFLSLQRGDVTIATPVLGLKLILVAILSTFLLGHPVPLNLWVAAFLSSLAIALLNMTGSGRHHHVAMTILLAGLSALMFALFDVLVRKWSPDWGAGRFLPAMMASVAILSIGLIPLFPAPLQAIPREAWRWLSSGCILFALQSVIFVTTVAIYGNVTQANVMYSSRGMWSVIGVWLIGHWFGNQERHLGDSVFRLRMIGAVLMTIAIVLALMK